ncbi:Protein GUCD1 [Blattella germanica]|nr:Protein GUCD1 [Blattella germanica]
MENTNNVVEADLPPKFEIRLQHYRQKYNWDCGVTCVLMVLPEVKREHLTNNFSEVCTEEDFNKSTWTIDLCYLLHRYGVKHLYCTITLGINPGYKGQSFYDKILQKDEERVTRRFKEAAELGIEVEKRSLTCYDFVRHLSESGPVILLTNASLLQCDVCKLNKLTAELRGCLPWSTTYTGKCVTYVLSRKFYRTRGRNSKLILEHVFTGHYIVLCGYSLSNQKFLYHNPAFKNRVCVISFATLDEARCSYGTDEDAILIYSSSWT